jgi:hypothetical protein
MMGEKKLHDSLSMLFCNNEVLKSLYPYATMSGLKVVLESSDGMRSSVSGLCFDIIELDKSFSNFKIAWCVGI